jgi:hypothetical protein
MVGLAGACGGAPAAEPEVPESTSAAGEAESADAPPEEPAEGATDETPTESPPASEAPSGTLSDDDLEDVIRQVLEDPGLDQYLHLDQPGRLPLKLSGPGLPAKLPIIKGSYEVKVVEAPASAKDPVLVFTKIERDGESVRLRYRYEVEGINGSAVVFRKDGAWRLGANRVIEK